MPQKALCAWSSLLRFWRHAKGLSISKNGRESLMPAMCSWSVAIMAVPRALYSLTRPFLRTKGRDDRRALKRGSTNQDWRSTSKVSHNCDHSKLMVFRTSSNHLEIGMIKRLLVNTIILPKVYEED